MVVSAVLFHRTVAPDVKLWPLTVRVKAAPPAAAEAGAKEVIAGSALMVNETVADGLAAGLVTLILTEPAVAIAEAGILAANCVVATNVVGSGDPFQFTVAPFWNPLPFTVRTNAPEAAGRAEGLTVPIVAVGAAIVQLKDCDAVWEGTLESVAVTVNAYGPGVMGVPFTVTVTPAVELSTMPGGSVPEEIDQ